MNNNNQQDNRKAMLIEADKLFDRGEVSQASELYEHAAWIYPSAAALSNLVLSKNLALLILLNKMLEKYPNNIDISLQKYTILMMQRDTVKNAYQLCSEIISQHGENIRLINLWKWRRVKAALMIPRTEFVYDDFHAVWKDVDSTNTKGRMIILREILAVSHSEFASVFEELSKSDLFSDEIKALFGQKYKYLRMLGDAFHKEFN